MTMHLAHPALTLSGHRRGKQRFRNSAEAQRARELEADWQDLKTRWSVPAVGKPAKVEPLSKTYSLRPPPGREAGPRIPSVDTGGPHSTAPVHKVYTGTKVLGIATMHKSNAVPVFAEEEAIEISRMRRG